MAIILDLFTFGELARARFDSQLLRGQDDDQVNNTKEQQAVRKMIKILELHERNRQ